MSLSTARILPNSSDFARGLNGFRLRITTELQTTGITLLDTILGGGVPRGSIVELCGTGSSGRTSLSFSLLAEATEQQEVCAYVDVSDSLDPLSLASAGVDLQRLLWIRCGTTETNSSPQPQQFLSHRQTSTPAKNQTLPYLENSCNQSRQTQMWRHPRDQIRGIETALPSVMRNTNTGKNEIRTRNVQPANLPRPKSGQTTNIPKYSSEPAGDSQRNRNWRKGSQNSNSNLELWKRLEQALKTTDLLLHSGGWGVVVFDLGNISWVDARRIEISTWFRFRRVIENTPTILLLLGEEPSAKSCSSLVLHCRRKHENWSHIDSQNAIAGVATLQGFEVEGKVSCSRTGLYPMDSACWTTRTLWTDSL